MRMLVTIVILAIGAVAGWWLIQNKAPAPAADVAGDNANMETVTGPDEINAELSVPEEPETASTVETLNAEAPPVEEEPADEPDTDDGN